VRVGEAAFMNLVFFILACFVVVPVCLLLVFLGQLTFLAHPDIATLIVVGALEITGALTAIVVLLHIFVRAVQHPMQHQVCFACRSQVAASASICRYCQTTLIESEIEDGDVEEEAAL